MYLLSFDPNKPFLDKTEKHLFEAFWLLVKGTPASGAELEVAFGAKTTVKTNSIEGGSLNLMMCPCCNQRWMQHMKTLRTIDKKADFIFDEEEFNFIKSCMSKWQMIGAELEEAFVELAHRFKSAQPLNQEQLKQALTAGA